MSDVPFTFQDAAAFYFAGVIAGILAVGIWRLRDSTTDRDPK